MGMDYIGEARGSFSLNWTGQAFVGRLLGKLGADPTEWAVTNDGDLISAETCEAWARLLRDNIDRVYVTTIRVPAPDNLATGAESDEYRTVPMVADVPVARRAVPEVFARALITTDAENPTHAAGKEPLFPPEPEDSTQLAAARFVELGPSTLDEASREMLLEFAGFLEVCGGCRQY